MFPSSWCCDANAPSARQVEELVKPEDAHGIDTSALGRSAAGDWFSVTFTVSIAEKMLDTAYNINAYESGRYLVCARKYSLPHSLNDHDLVQPTKSS